MCFLGEGWCFHSNRKPEKPQGLDTDLDDILHPEEKEEVTHGVACGFHRGHVFSFVQIVGMGKEW